MRNVGNILTRQTYMSRPLTASRSKRAGTENWTLRKRRSRAGRKTGQNGDLDRRKAAVFDACKFPWRHRSKPAIRPEMAAHAGNRKTLTPQELFFGQPSPVFVRGCGQRSARGLTRPWLGRGTYWLPTYSASRVHSGYSRKRRLLSWRIFVHRWRMSFSVVGILDRRERKQNLASSWAVQSIWIPGSNFAQTWIPNPSPVFAALHAQLLPFKVFLPTAMRNRRDDSAVSEKLCRGDQRGRFSKPIQTELSP